MFSDREWWQITSKHAFCWISRCHKLISWGVTFAHNAFMIDFQDFYWDLDGDVCYGADRWRCQVVSEAIRESSSGSLQVIRCEHISRVDEEYYQVIMRAIVNILYYKFEMVVRYGRKASNETKTLRGSWRQVNSRRSLDSCYNINKSTRCDLIYGKTTLVVVICEGQSQAFSVTLERDGVKPDYYE